MTTCESSVTFVERPDEDKRRALLWGSLAAASAILALQKHRAQNRIHDLATRYYEAGMPVDDALAKAAEEIAIESK